MNDIDDALRCEAVELDALVEQDGGDRSESTSEYVAASGRRYCLRWSVELIGEEES